MAGISRDNLPVLKKQNSSEPLWTAAENWTSVTPFRTYPDAKRVILAIGAPAFLAGDAAESLTSQGTATDVIIINGLPIDENTLPGLFKRYGEGIVTVEDGLIGTRDSGLRGFAGFIAGAAYGTGIPMAHIGINDPRIAPSDGHMEVWQHFRITRDSIIEAVTALS